MPTVDFHGLAVPVETYDTVAMGSGAAGLNCAAHLHDFGARDTAAGRAVCIWNVSFEIFNGLGPL